MTSYRRLFAAFLALCAVGAIAGCGSSGSSSSSGAGSGGGNEGASTTASQSAEAGSGDEATSINMAIEPWIGYGPWWLVAEEGFDKENGFTLNLTNFNEDAPLAAAYASGQIQAVNTSMNEALSQLSRNIEMKLILLEDSSNTADAILAGSDVNSVKELEGKSVAYEEGSTSDVLLRYALSQNGMSMDDINPVLLPAASAGAAVIAGKVDAGVTYQPYISAALDKGSGFHVVYDAGERPGLISDTLGVNPEFAEENPGLMSSALKAWNQAIDFYRENPEEAQEIIAKNIGAKPDELTSSFEGIKLYDLDQSQELLSQQFGKVAPELETILEEAGALKTKPDVETAVDLSYGEAALEDKE